MHQKMLKFIYVKYICTTPALATDFNPRFRFANVSKRTFNFITASYVLMLSCQRPLEQVLSGLELSDPSELLEALLPSGLQLSGQEPSGLDPSCLQRSSFLLEPLQQLLQLYL